MRARDIGVALVAVTSAFVALRGTSDVNLQLRWMTGERAKPRRDSHPVPLPLVTDLDGDGKDEIVVLANDGKSIKVLAVPSASGQTLVDPWVLHEVDIAPASRLREHKRAVAMAVGHMKMRPKLLDEDMTSMTEKEQYLVVIREDWSVVCFDHNLKRMWKREMDHERSPAEDGAFVIDQAAITVTKVEGTKNGVYSPGPGGVVVVGASMRRQGAHEHTRAHRDPFGDSFAGADGADPLGVHVEAFVEGEEDSRDEDQEAQLSKDEQRRRAAGHFSMFALDGTSGTVKWRHVSSTHQQDQQTDRPEVATPAGLNRAPSYRWPQYKLEELKYHTNVADSGGRDESADGDINRTNTRRFRRSLLRRLPHAWSSPVDTRLEIASLSRRGPGKAGDSDTQKKSAAGDANTFFLGDGRKLGDDPSETETSGGSVMAVVARTRDGLEAVDLNTGRPLIAVTLPAAASGAGVYVDINGDDLVDHVEAVGTRGGEGWGHLHSGRAMGHLSEPASPSQAQQTRRLPPCYALAVSGYPPREQLFNGSLCHDAGPLLGLQERLSRPSSRAGARSLDIEVSAAAPAILRREYPSQVPRSDVVFAVSSGVVSSYDDEGRLNWQHTNGPTWSREGLHGDDIGGYVIPFNLEVVPSGSGNRRKVSPPASEERILVVGQDKMCVYDRNGRLEGSTRLRTGPSMIPVVRDFDGDGMADVIIVGWGGELMGYALTRDPGIQALFVAVLVLIGTMLVVAAVYVPPPGSSARWTREDGRGRGASQRWGQQRRGKSKRATD